MTTDKISTSIYWRQVFRFSTTVRAGLVSMIFTQTVNLRNDDLADSAAVTLWDESHSYSSVTFRTRQKCLHWSRCSSSLLLKRNQIWHFGRMGTNVERILGASKSIHEAWASITAACIAIWLLERQLWTACLIPLGIAVGKFNRANLDTNRYCYDNMLIGRKDLLWQWDQSQPVRGPHRSSGLRRYKNASLWLRVCLATWKPSRCWDSRTSCSLSSRTCENSN